MKRTAEIMDTISENHSTDRLANVQFHSLSTAAVSFNYWSDSDRLNAELREVILKNMKQSPGRVLTNRGGWQSQPDVHTWPEPCIAELRERIQLLVKEMVRHHIPDADERHLNGWKINTCWANVNFKGAFNKSHDHDGLRSLFSGFYYVDVGDLAAGSDVTGRTFFEDRSGVPKEIIRNPDVYEREFTLDPKPGTMTLFNGRQFHYVEPYSGNGVRISIAFNLYHDGFRVPYYEGMQPKNWWWTNFRAFAIAPQKFREKLIGLKLIPKKFRQSETPLSGQESNFISRLRIAVDHAFAEAASRFESVPGDHR